MELIQIYKTKAKWRVHLDKNDLPVLGYDRYAAEEAVRGVDVGHNVLLWGSLMLTGTSRGRSAAHFDMSTKDGWEPHATMSGAEKIFRATSGDDTLSPMVMSRDTWELQEYSHREDTIPVSGPVFTGYWTIAKQGTEISVVPALESTVANRNK